MSPEQVETMLDTLDASYETKNILIYQDGAARRHLSSNVLTGRQIAEQIYMAKRSIQNVETAIENMKKILGSADTSCF